VGGSLLGCADKQVDEDRADFRSWPLAAAPAAKPAGTAIATSAKPSPAKRRGSSARAGAMRGGQRRDFIALGLIQPHTGKPQAGNGDDQIRNSSTCYMLRCIGPLMAQSGRRDAVAGCLLWGVKRTSQTGAAVSAFDPERSPGSFSLRATACRAREKATAGSPGGDL
jgi:hypothetical protein